MSDAFVAVRVEGGLLPADLLSRLQAGREVAGLGSADYHLAAGETVREAANRAWSYLTGVWRTFRDAVEKLPQGDRATTLTRERWLLVLARELGFGRLPTTPTGGIVAAGKSFPISHHWENVPVHLLGWGVDLDHRSRGVVGAADAAPQSLVQECLNRSDVHLWALLSNGRVLRVLRDSTSLVGSAYVEFDLQAIFDGDLFSDFLLLYTLCHQSRFESLDAEIGPASCWLERWRTQAVEAGTRARNLLRDGVVKSLELLGTGFLRHPNNRELRDDLADGRLRLDDFHHALLRTVYRLLFLFVAEDRGALLKPKPDPAAAQRYRDYFSTARLRAIARRRRGTPHPDLWRALRLVIDGLGRENGLPELGLPGVGGIFESGDLDVFQRCDLANNALLPAIRELSLVRERGGPLRPIDYRNLGAEELGSIYESLLELIPRHDAGARTFSLSDAATGGERKSTGSYYTPTQLVERLLDSALDPVLDEAMQEPDPRAALLDVTVCDPACGSGHFLVAAARRIAKRIAFLDTGDPESPPPIIRAALREVVGRCIYGVDVNPLAAELAKISLWLEAMEPGRPLTYLDAQIRVGNSLLGTTPALLADGIPDAAFKPIEGDDRKAARALLQQNRHEARGQETLFETDSLRASNVELGAETWALVRHMPISLADVHAQAQRHRQLSEKLAREREIADAWCAAFVQQKTADNPTPITHDTLTKLANGTASAEMRNAVKTLAAEYRFFHWHLEFPHIFAIPSVPGPDTDPTTGWEGGFSVVLGNPPWERVKLQEQEFFAARDPEIAAAPNAAARKQLIKKLKGADPQLHAQLLAARRRAEGESHLLRMSGRYPLTGRGDINTYAVFAETDRMLINAHGRLGVILPTGIATDATTQYFFRDLIESSSLASLYDFENRDRLFPGIATINRFSLLTVTGQAVREGTADFAFFCHNTSDLDRAGVRFALKPDEITLLNPNTGTCPVFRSRRDAEITLGIYRRVPVLIKDGDPNGNPWGVTFMRMFDMSNDAHLFHTRDELEAAGWTLTGNTFTRDGERVLPLYEAKMLHHCNHRDGDYSWAKATLGKDVRYLPGPDATMLSDPSHFVLPRYWVAEREVKYRIGSYSRGWFVGFRNVTNTTTNRRTFIVGALPVVAVGNSMPLVLSTRPPPTFALLAAILSSFVLDFVTRQKLGGTNLNFFYIEQLPVPSPRTCLDKTPWDPDREIRDWILDRVLELTFTAWDMAPFAGDLGYVDGPFIWDAERRALLRAEVDAAFFHLYGIERGDVDYILDTFPIVKRNDEAKHGEYRTKRLILEIYDAMAKAIQTDAPYQTILNPPPGQGPTHPREEK